MKGIIIFILAFILLFFSNTFFFIVDETNQVVLTRFGKNIRTITKPGLYIKTPFIDITHYFDKRILDYDSSPKEIITADKKNMVIDNFAKWKIIEPLKFYESVGNEYQAQLRLDDIIYSVLRERLGKYTLDQIVSPKRVKIMEEVTKLSNEKVEKNLGIKVQDVEIKRADLPKENEKHIFDRMREEREKQAKSYRSEGQKNATVIRSEADKKIKIILSEATMKADIIKGEGDAQALKIYADTYNKDPDFYSFFRTMQAYEKMFTNNDVIILDSNNELFKYFKDYQK